MECHVWISNTAASENEFPTQKRHISRSVDETYPVVFLWLKQESWMHRGTGSWEESWKHWLCKRPGKKVVKKNLMKQILILILVCVDTVCKILFVYYYTCKHINGYIYIHRMYDQHNRWVRRSSWKFWSVFLDHDFSIVCAWLKK